ncbi:hypothetical protein ACLMJK_008946 [Lecanora helva]
MDISYDDPCYNDSDFHKSMCPTNEDSTKETNSTHLEEIKTTPLFSAQVLAKVLQYEETQKTTLGDTLRAYGFLARTLETFNDESRLSIPTAAQNPTSDRDRHGTLGPTQREPQELKDDRLMVNMNAPWMATMPKKLAGIVFHYDKLMSGSSTQVCEAAYLASKIPVTVLVAPTEYEKMKKTYENLPGLEGRGTLEVKALLLHEKHLDVERIKRLMAVEETEGKMALYIESVLRILRSMALQKQKQDQERNQKQDQKNSGFNFGEFEQRIEAENFTPGQKVPLTARLSLLKSFIWRGKAQGSEFQFRGSKKEQFEEQDEKLISEMGDESAWSFEPGTLTIIDLSSAFVDERTACLLFDICLSIFIDNREKAGRIVALDEALKFMTANNSSSQFTENLLRVIRQQRHMATRVIIATQEPTISPALLDLCSMTIVHRFTSRQWMTALKSHLAAVTVDGEGSRGNAEEIYRHIVHLDAGQALVFSPSAMLSVDERSNPEKLRMRKLGTGYVKMQVRQRLTVDGGRSQLAVET